MQVDTRILPLDTGRIGTEVERRMNFYTLDYIVSHQSADSVLRVGMMLALLLAAIVFTVLYLRDRIRTRWRDAGVGAIILLLVLVGVQTEQYFRVSNRISQSQLLVKFVEGVAEDQHVSENEVLVNSTSLKDGIIVRLNEEDYLVHLNDDNNSYTLERTHTIDHNVYVNGER